MNARNLDDNQTPTQITAAEKAAFLADPEHRAGAAATLTLTQIMSQKYIAQWAWGHNELWMDMRRYHYTDIDPASGNAGLPGLRAADESVPGQRRQDRAAHPAAVQLRVRVEPCRRSTPSAALATGLPHEAALDHSTVTTVMTRYPTHSRRCWAPRLSPPADKNGVQDITAPDRRRVHQVLQLRRERAGGELLRQRHEGDGDQLDQLHASHRPAESAVHDRRASKSTTGTAYGASPTAGCTRRSRPANTRSADESPPPPTTDSRSPSSRRRSPTASTTRSTQAAFYDAPPKSMDAFVVEDVFSETSTSASRRFGFVNASSNSSPMTLYAKNTATGDSVSVGSSVAYKSGGAFVHVPAAAVRSDGAIRRLEHGRHHPLGRSFVRGGTVYTSTLAATRRFPQPAHQRTGRFCTTVANR